MQKIIIIIYYSFIYKDKFVILQLLIFKIIYNIFTTITLLINFNKFSSDIHSNLPQFKQPQLSSHFYLSTPSTFHSFPSSNPNKTYVSIVSKNW